MRGNLDGVDNDHLSGWAIDDDDPKRHIPIEIEYNGEIVMTTVANYPRPDLVRAGVGDGSHGFYVAMPAISEPEEAVVQVYEAGTREPMGVPRTLTRRPKCSPRGLLAAEVLRLSDVPLHSMSGIQFNGNRLVITGLHLPPGGDPFALRVTAAPGIEFTAEYPLLNENAGNWYWYWPNSRWSSYRITVDLAASTHVGSHFEFAFETDSADPAFTALGRNELFVPKDIGIYQNFPTDDQLTRVQRFDHAGRVALAGYDHFQHMARIARHYGVDLGSAAVLDWGCGHGRVIRHFAAQGAAREAWGVDIDRENASWLADHIPGVKALTVPLEPPTDLPDAHFDFIYAISVMTHLTRELQELWLAELQRVTRPGGIVALTFAGDASVAFSSRFLVPEWLTGWLDSGFDDTLDSQDLDDKIGDNNYYRNTKQSEQVTRELWGKYFDVLDVHRCMFGYQDIAVMRARPIGE